MNKKLNITLEKGEYISKENNVLYIRKKLENYLGEERNNHKFKMGNREYYSEYYVEKEIERLNNIIKEAREICKQDIESIWKEEGAYMEYFEEIIDILDKGSDK